jgi:hypothetical protein
MTSPNPTRVLVITDRVAATPSLLDTIRGRAARGPATFRILVPNPAAAEWHPTHPERHDKVAEAERVLAQALPLIEEAAGHAVEGLVSTRHDPMDAIEEALHDEPFDEIIIATAPHNVERWLHVDLPHRVAHLGLPVTAVTRDHRAERGDAGSSSLSGAASP